MNIELGCVAKISVDELREISLDEVNEDVDDVLDRLHGELMMSALSFRNEQNERIERLIRFCNTGLVE